MIRKLFPVILVAGLTACASSGTQQTSSDTSTYGGGSSSSGSASTCDAQPVQNQVGQPYSESLNSDLQSDANASQLRVLKPGELMTMEYDPTRLNVIIEKDGSISALRCG